MGLSVWVGSDVVVSPEPLSVDVTSVCWLCVVAVVAVVIVVEDRVSCVCVVLEVVSTVVDVVSVVVDVVSVVVDVVSAADVVIAVVVVVVVVDEVGRPSTSVVVLDFVVILASVVLIVSVVDIPSVLLPKCTPCPPPPPCGPDRLRISEVFWNTGTVSTTSDASGSKRRASTDSARKVTRPPNTSKMNRHLRGTGL